MKSKTKKKERTGGYKKIFRNTDELVLDELHTIGIGQYKILRKNAIKNYYNKIAFDFKMLEQAREFFESFMGNTKTENIEVYIGEKLPIIFVYKKELGIRDRDPIFAIAPRIRDDD